MQEPLHLARPAMPSISGHEPGAMQDARTGPFCQHSSTRTGPVPGRCEAVDRRPGRDCALPHKSRPRASRSVEGGDRTDSIRCLSTGALLPSLPPQTGPRVPPRPGVVFLHLKTSPSSPPAEAAWHAPFAPCRRIPGPASTRRRTRTFGPPPTSFDTHERQELPSPVSPCERLRRFPASACPPAPTPCGGAVRRSCAAAPGSHGMQPDQVGRPGVEHGRLVRRGLRLVLRRRELRRTRILHAHRAAVLRAPRPIQAQAASMPRTAASHCTRTSSSILVPRMRGTRTTTFSRRTPSPVSRSSSSRRTTTTPPWTSVSWKPGASASSGFLKAADAGTRVVADNGFGQAGPTPWFQRFAPFVVIFDDLVDPDTLNAASVRVRGRPRRDPLRGPRVPRPEPRRLGQLAGGGGPRFYSSRLVIDPAISELAPSTRRLRSASICSASREASTRTRRTSRCDSPRARSPARSSRCSRTWSSSPLTTAQNGSFDFSTLSREVVRAFRAGGRTGCHWRSRERLPVRRHGSQGGRQSLRRDHRPARGRGRREPHLHASRGSVRHVGGLRHRPPSGRPDRPGPVLRAGARELGAERAGHRQQPADPAHRHPRRLHRAAQYQASGQGPIAYRTPYDAVEDAALAFKASWRRRPVRRIRTTRRSTSPPTWSSPFVSMKPSILASWRPTKGSRCCGRTRTSPAQAGRSPSSRPTTSPGR